MKKAELIKRIKSEIADIDNSIILSTNLANSTTNQASYEYHRGVKEAHEVARRRFIYLLEEVEK